MMLSYKGEPPWSQRAYLDSYRVPLIASMPVRATPSVHPGKYQVQPMNNHESTLIFFIVSSYISRQIKSRLNKTPPNFSVIQTFLQGWPLYDRVLSMPRASLLLRRGRVSRMESMLNAASWTRFAREGAVDPSGPRLCFPHRRPPR